MRRTGRFVLLIAVLALMLPLLAACGGTADPTSTPQVQPTESTGPTATVASATEPPGSTPTTAGDPTATSGSTDPTSTEAPSSTPTSAQTNPTATSTPSTPGGPTATPGTPLLDEPFVYGWNVALRGDENGQNHNFGTNILVQQTGFEWVRFQMEWGQFQRWPEAWDPLPMDRVIQNVFSSGLNILVTVAKAPDWALDPTGEQFLSDYGDFEEFMAFVSDRYKGRVQAWEIWNEQNLAYEVNGTVRPEDYLDLLRAGHAGIKRGDPNALIVFGGLTPNGVNDPSIAIDDVLYLDAVYSLNNGEIMQYYDIMGVHVSATQTSPDHSWPDNPGPEAWGDHGSFYFRRAEELRDVMLAHGDDATMMWITEFGWTTENMAPGYEYGQFNTEEDVAEYLTRSFEIMLFEWDFVSGAFVWNMNWSTLVDPSDEKFPWSAVNADWSPRPAFEAMRVMRKY